ncbi:MAG TPA: lysine exporter LysO family protein [Thermotoga sp.]|nr:lysine exporter LysO family protein [Thermotoga sp.]
MILLVLISVGAGIILGTLDLGNSWIFSKGVDIFLALLIFFVGWEMGSDVERVQRTLKKGYKLLFIPFFSILGSIVAGFIIGLFLKIGPKGSMIVASGMGWYSFTGSFLTSQGFETLGTVAFISNILREILTIFFAPLLAKIDALAPVVSGGATSMDSTLGVIRLVSGKDVEPISFLNGFIITLMIPIVSPLLVEIFLK